MKKERSANELYAVLSLLSFATRDFLVDTTDNKLREKLTNLVNLIDKMYLNDDEEDA